MSTAQGRNAEAVAADYLAAHGFTIIHQNWRTRWCEIDIIAYKNETVYFVEVKYRRRETWGSGLEYITPRKLQQMHFAAEFWMARHSAENYRLAAIELTDEPPRVTQWIDTLA